MHDSGLRPWHESGWFSAGVNRLLGWILGTLLACLPWRVLCSVQSWAEGEAARIYAETLADLNALRGVVIESSLLERLAHARDQELEHASRFVACLDGPGKNP